MILEDSIYDIKNNTNNIDTCNDENKANTMDTNNNDDHSDTDSKI